MFADLARWTRALPGGYDPSMSAAHYQMIAVRPRRGGMTHATSLTNSRLTACGKKCDGWVVAPVDENQFDRAQIDCQACKAVMFKRVAP